MSRRIRLAGMTIGLVAVLGVSGCQWDGLNSLPLPGAEGTGEGSWQVRIQMPNVTMLTPNSPVKVNDVSVGTVRKIEVEDWHALVTVSLEKGVELPANAVARVGQTSLLGSNHLELDAPEGEPAQGRLQDGDVIPLSRAGAFPTTEQTLSSLSVVLNGGGMSQVETITRELNATFTGRTDAIRDLLPQLTELTTTLDQQTGDIIAAMAGLDRFGGVLAQQKDQVAAAITTIHPALTVLADRRVNITNAITSLADLSDVVQRIIDEGGDSLKANVANLEPALKSLADTGGKLAESLQWLLTFPFPIKNIDKVIKGDYMNLWMTADLTASRLDSNFLTGTALGGSLGGVQSTLGLGIGVPATAMGTGDPLTDPYKNPAETTAPEPSIPGLPPIPGLPAIPGLTVPADGQGGTGQ